MEWAGREKHMGGIPRKLVIMAVGTFAKAVATLLNTTSVHNADTLIHLVRSRPPGVPLITVSNHMSTSVIGLSLSFFLLCKQYDCVRSTLIHTILYEWTGWMIQWCGGSRVFPPLMLTWLDGYFLPKIFASKIHSYLISFD